MFKTADGRSLYKKILIELSVKKPTIFNETAGRKKKDCPKAAAFADYI